MFFLKEEREKRRKDYSKALYMQPTNRETDRQTDRDTERERASDMSVDGLFYERR